jgi:hypothetical protein
MAAGIDLGFVSLKLAQLVVRRYRQPAITGTLAGSAALNALAFAAQSAGWMLAPATGALISGQTKRCSRPIFAHLAGASAR